jgi:hypothetical protein
MGETTLTAGRHDVTRVGATRSMHAAAVVQRETGRTFFANPAMPPRHAAPEWPTADLDVTAVA